MPRFELRQPIETTEPVVTVDAGLPAGTHRFQLAVRDRAGRESPPVEVQVRVEGGVRPRVPPAPPIRRPTPLGPGRRR